MDKCFRFLINVDHCLDMSVFDIFFYKLKSQQKFRLDELEIGDSECSFRPAFQNIQVHLNKYPYHFRAYQLIIAMRGTWHQASSKWESTLLRRLMQIGYELHREDICLEVDFSVERALNLFMLYETDPHRDPPGSTPYMTSDRLRNDCSTLLEHMGLCSNRPLDTEQVNNALQLYRTLEPQDEAAVFYMEQFLASQRDLPKSKDSLTVIFSDFLKECFDDYQVTERWLPRDVQHFSRENTLEMLRIVEFINRSVEQASPGKDSLISRCRQNWEVVEKDTALEQKYSRMLSVYEKTLRHMHLQLGEETVPAVPNAARLPDSLQDSKGEIGNPDSIFEKEKDKARTLTAMLDDFLEKEPVSGNGKGSWDDIHNQLESSLFSLEGELKRYADDLSRQYTQKVERRKKEARYHRNRLFLADEHTGDRIAALENERDTYLQQLREPDMTPSARFKDQDQVEAALQRANKEITHYITCLHGITWGGFLAVFLAVLLLTFGHYVTLQPYVVSEWLYISVTVHYVLIMVTGLLLTRRLPAKYYRNATESSVHRLKEITEQYVSGYYGRAEKFREYINTLDRLDNTVKLLELYGASLETTRKIHRGCMWHKTRIEDHLHKLSAFWGLMDCTATAVRPVEYSTGELLDDQGQIRNIEQCSLYWPQGRGDTV